MIVLAKEEEKLGGVLGAKGMINGIPATDYVAKYFDGRLLYVPRGLEDDALDSRELGRSESRETAYLTWSLAYSRGCHELQNNGWARIHSDAFSFANDATIAKARKWLIREGHLEVAEGYSAGHYSKSYRAKKFSEPVLVELTSKTNIQLLGEETANDPMCQVSRENLNHLQCDETELAERLLQVIDTYLRQVKAGEKGGQRESHPCKHDPERALYQFGRPLLALLNKKGRVVRGRCGNRLFSPMTNLKKDFRSLFHFGGPMVELDMRCAQPCLLGNLSGDRNLVGDCMSNNFYERIMDAYGLDDRDEAKGKYYHYAYGRIGCEPEMAELMAKYYPKANAYLISKKQDDYRVFSHEMQRAEADLFVDGVLPELQRRQILGLTIHDAVLVLESEKDCVRETIEKKLEESGYRGRIEEEAAARGAATARA